MMQALLAASVHSPELQSPKQQQMMEEIGVDAFQEGFQEIGEEGRL